MGLAKCKKQCLIETHSENLISQLRLHIVKAGGMDKSDCMIYFVEEDKDKGAIFNKIDISPKGRIRNWPRGFFDESIRQEEQITDEGFRQRLAK
jgi:predicted ATPase